MGDCPPPKYSSADYVRHAWGHAPLTFDQIQDGIWSQEVGTCYRLTLRMVEFLTKINAHLKPGTFYSACRLGHLELVKWCVAHGVPFKWRKIRRMVIARDVDPAVLEYLASKFPVMCRLCLFGASGSKSSG